MEPIIATIASALLVGAAATSEAMISEASKDLYLKLKSSLFGRAIPEKLKNIENGTASYVVNSVDEVIAETVNFENNLEVLDFLETASLLLEKLSQEPFKENYLQETGINIEEVIAKNNINLKSIVSDGKVSISNIQSDSGDITIENIRSKKTEK